jgi:hypothetical protein
MRQVANVDEWAEFLALIRTYAREDGPTVLECVERDTGIVRGRVEYHEGGTKTYYIDDSNMA